MIGRGSVSVKAGFVPARNRGFSVGKRSDPGWAGRALRARLGDEIQDLDTHIEFTRGNKTRAAETLGVSVKTLYNKLGQYGLDLSKGGAAQMKSAALTGSTIAKC